MTQIRRDEVVKALRKAGLFQIADLATQELADRVELSQLDAFFEPYQITRDSVEDLLGGGP
jgi:hypothetical protein